MNDKNDFKELIWMMNCKLKNDYDYIIMINQDLKSLELIIIKYH